MTYCTPVELVILFVCVDVTDCCFLLFEVLHLFSVYFDLNIGCLIIDMLKSKEHDHDSKDPQTRIRNLGPTYQNLTIMTHLKKKGHNPKIKRLNYRAWLV